MKKLKKEIILFLCTLLLTHVYSLSIELVCDNDKLLCGDGQKCIEPSKLCDYNIDCEDSSDETNFDLCKKLSSHKGRCSSSGSNFPVQCNAQYRYGYSSDYAYLQNQCMDVITACALGSKCLNAEDLSICPEIVNNMLKPSWIPKELPLETKNDRYHDFYEMLEFIGEAFNETIKRNFSECPPFFTPFEGKCLSFFTPAQITWSEARLFCESISGRLAVLDDIHKYKIILDYIKKKEIKSNFWIGGFLGNDLTKENRNSSELWVWSWLDGKPVEMGAPFWSLTFQNPNPSYEVCSNSVKSLMPRNTEKKEICLAILEENFYYFSDENCNLKYSPICITNSSKK